MLKSFKEFIANQPMQPTPIQLKLQQLAKQVASTPAVNPNAPPNPTQQAQQKKNDDMNQQILKLKPLADAEKAKQIAASIDIK